MHWAIFYGDGSRFDCTMGQPKDAPGMDVQVIVQEDPDRVWISQAKADYYVWDDRGSGSRWWGVDQFGLWEYLFFAPGNKVVKAGKTRASLDYQRIWEQAINDPMFGQKATFARHELRPDR